MGSSSCGRRGWPGQVNRARPNPSSRARTVGDRFVPEAADGPRTAAPLIREEFHTVGESVIERLNHISGDQLASLILTQAIVGIADVDVCKFAVADRHLVHVIVKGEGAEPGPFRRERDDGSRPS